MNTIKLHRNINKDKVRIRCIDMSDSDYQGMNYYANKELHTGFKMRENDILVHKKLTNKQKHTTIRHEIIEKSLMSKGVKYNKADKIALKYE